MEDTKDFRTAPSGEEAFRLLLVEDNPGDAELACERLASVPDYAFDLTCVTRLRDALDVLHRGRIDAVLLDLTLPDSQGIDTLRRLRSVREDVPIVVLSGVSDDELRRLALREGAQDFIGKNEPPAVLLARIMPSALERHRAQEQHRQIERLVAVHPDAVIVADANGVVRFVNAAATALFGKNAEDLVGAPLEFPVEQGSVREIEFARGGETLVAEMRAVACEWEKQPAFLVSVRDITDRKRMSEQLRQAQKMEAVGLLAGGIAHDFNNLLLVMLFYAEFLREKLDADDPRSGDVMEILRAVERAQGLIAQLLAFSRRQAIKPRLVDLNDVVAGIRKILQRTFPANYEVVALTRDRLWPVLVDAGQIEQLLMNLAVNAKDAMPHGGRFTIELDNVRHRERGGPIEPGEYVAMQITDTGEGISPDHIKRIFEPFFTTKAPGKGTGLGLATCYGIVRQAGGDVQVRSELGAGTTFTVLLPRAKGAAEPAQANGQQAERLRGTETVLIVEDNAAVLKSAARVLREHGYSVVQATNGEQARRLIQQQGDRIDLVLTDLVMPYMTGAELAERLDVSHPQLKVLFTTGYSEDVLGDETMLDPERPLLHKPYTPRQLLQKVREVLEDGNEIARRMMG
jgi:signal transduction histidine kinase